MYFSDWLWYNQEFDKRLSMAFFVMNIVGSSTTVFIAAQTFSTQLKTEYERSESLLLNMMPQSVAERLKGGETNIVDDENGVTILFAGTFAFMFTFMFTSKSASAKSRSQILGLLLGILLLGVLLSIPVNDYTYCISSFITTHFLNRKHVASSNLNQYHPCH